MATTRQTLKSDDLAAIIAKAVADGVAAAMASRPVPSEPDPVALSSAMTANLAATERAERKAGKVATPAPAGIAPQSARSRFDKLVAHHAAVIANPESRSHAVAWSQQTVAMLTDLLASEGSHDKAMTAFDADRKARRERRAMKRDQAASNAAEIASLRAEIAKLRGK